MERQRRSRVQRRKNRKLHKFLILFGVLAVLGIALYIVIVAFSIESIEVQGNRTYTNQEIVSKIENDDDYIDNTLAMLILQKISKKNYLPFIDTLTMSFDQPHILKVQVKEGIRAGVFEEMGQKVYFDSEGIAWETRDSLVEGVPVVTGVKFSKSENGAHSIVLGEKIPVEGDYYDTILTITKKIATYNLKISKIDFVKENDIYLFSGNYTIYLGNSQYIGSKMSKISDILDAVSEKYEGGTIDMHLFTDEKDIITFFE